MKSVVRILARGATTIALATGAVGVLSTAAWASPVTGEPAMPAVTPTASVSALPADFPWGDRNHHSSDADCRNHHGHGVRLKNGHWVCRGGDHNGWWY